MSGTSLRDLQMKENMDQMNNQRNEQMTNMMLPPRAANYPNPNPNPNLNPNISNNNNNIEQLAREINSKLDKINPLLEGLEDEEKKKKENKEKDSEDREDDIKEKSNYLDKYTTPEIRDALIIFILYVVLSTSLVKDTFTKFIPQITQGSNTSIAIYGFILAILYIIIKKIIS